MENGTAVVKEEGRTDEENMKDEKVNGEAKVKVSWLSSLFCDHFTRIIA